MHLFGCTVRKWGKFLMKTQNCKDLMICYLLQVKLGALDATVHTVKSSQYGVQGYPTIKYFPPGKKDASSASEYNGGRTGSDIVNWALEMLAENVPAPEVKQVFLFYSVQKRVVGVWRSSFLEILKRHLSNCCILRFFHSDNFTDSFRCPSLVLCDHYKHSL
jgi:hypothetical protein